MAKRKTAKDIDDKDPEAPKSEHRKLIERVRSRYKVMSEADQDNRDEAMLDLKFVNEPGAQWDIDMRKLRGKRPCYEFNELRIKCKRVINDMRANRPQAKVRGYEDSDKDTAEVIEGLGRNIWNTSDADTIIDNAGEYQVAGGMGAWRIVTEYSGAQSFDQDCFIEQIKNPFCLYWDPAAQDYLKRDAEDWILTEKIARKAYEARWPGKEVVDFETDDLDDDEDWGTDDADSEMVRIAEYWYKEPVTLELLLLSDGKVVDLAETPQLPEGVTVVKTRKEKSHKIMMAVVSGDAVLDKPQVCAGREHRFVVAFGEHLVIDGKQKWWGLPRFGKDAQRNVNITNTAAIESTSRFLQAPFWATLKQFEGLEAKTAEAFAQGFPVAYYNPDPMAPGAPQRTGGPDLPIAMLELGQKASELLKSTTGIYDANLGSQSQEKSGRAIIARQQQGEIATFNYMDNMAKAVQRTWEILLDLIPHVYDTERSIRVLGADGADSYAKVNTFVQDPATGEVKALNDLRKGKYDVTITVGPNFATKRQEAVEIYGQLFASNPALQQVAGDLFFKAMDAPYADEIAERFKTMLPPQIQQMLSKDKQQSPEVAQGMMQAQQAMQQVQQMGQMVQQAAQESEQKKAEAEKAESGVQVAIANLKTQQAQFEAQVAKAQADLAQKSAQLSQMQGTDGLAQERQELSAQVQQATIDLQKQFADFVQQAVATMAEIQARQQTQVIVPPSPKPIRIDLVRNNGHTSAVPVYANTLQ